MTPEQNLAKAYPTPPIARAALAGDEAYANAIHENDCELVATARITALDWGGKKVWVSSGPMAIPLEHRKEFAARLRGLADLFEGSVEREKGRRVS